jgi:alkylhydroperoxidase AhpD family core domain
MDHSMYPDTTRDLHEKRRELAPEAYAAFRTFSQKVFADGALPSKTKQLIAVAVAHVTQCPYCIRGHTEAARKQGRHRAGSDGGDLGRGGNARRRRLRAREPGDRHDEPNGGEAIGRLMPVDTP